MVDRQKAELYQHQLAQAQAAWANFGGAAGGYSPSPAHTAGFGAGPGAGHTPGPGSSYYDNLAAMQRLQQYAGSLSSGATTNSGGSNVFGSGGFLGGGSKDMTAGFGSPFLPGHPASLYPGLGNYPLPAHAPLPAHLKSSASPAVATGPLPAHMRSSPYQQQSAAYHSW